jgi:hypothetical protein
MAADWSGTGLQPAASVAMIVTLDWLKKTPSIDVMATFENDRRAMKTLAVVSILALLTISGAAYTDQILTSDQQTARRAN